MTKNLNSCLKYDCGYDYYRSYMNIMDSIKLKNIDSRVGKLFQKLRKTIPALEIAFENDQQNQLSCLFLQVQSYS